uniref:Putative secreted peptide n=1 Tax=Anopheles braziliensis TaxID=58242 RepID=A0A2M3ZUK7_9DIPT
MTRVTLSRSLASFSFVSIATTVRSHFTYLMYSSRIDIFDRSARNLTISALRAHTSGLSRNSKGVIFLAHFELNAIRKQINVITNIRYISGSVNFS